MRGSTFIQRALGVARGVFHFAASGETNLHLHDLLPLLGGVEMKELPHMNNRGLKDIAKELESRVRSIDIAGQLYGIDTGAFSTPMKNVIHSIRDHSATEFDPAQGVPVMTYDLRKAIEGRQVLHEVIDILTKRSKASPSVFKLVFANGAFCNGLIHIAKSHSMDIALTKSDTDLEISLRTQPRPYTQHPSYINAVAFNIRNYHAARAALAPAAYEPGV